MYHQVGTKITHNLVILSAKDTKPPPKTTTEAPGPLRLYQQKFLYLCLKCESLLKYCKILKKISNILIFYNTETHFIIIHVALKVLESISTCVSQFANNTSIDI